MKNIVFLLMYSLPVLAQDASFRQIAAACGPASAAYKVSEGAYPQKAVDAEASTATVVFITEPIGFHTGCGIVTRVGFDQAWKGALCLGQSLVTHVQPGEHHVCTDFQHKPTPKYTALHSFDAVPGRVYYFRAVVSVATDQDYSIHLDLIDKDEGSLLYESSRIAISSPK